MPLYVSTRRPSINSAVADETQTRLGLSSDATASVQGTIVRTASTTSKIAARMYQRRGLACLDTRHAFKVLASWRQNLSRSWRNAAARRAPIREIDRRIPPFGLPPGRVLDESGSEVFEASRWILECGEDRSPLRSGEPKYRGAIEQRRLQPPSHYGGHNLQELPQ